MSKNEVLFQVTSTGKKVHIVSPRAAWYVDESFCGIGTNHAVPVPTNFTGLNDKNLCKTCKKAYKARGARV